MDKQNNDKKGRPMKKQNYGKTVYRNYEKNRIVKNSTKKTELRNNRITQKHNNE